MRTNIKLLAGVAALSLALVGAAVAQTYPPAQMPTIGTNDLFQDVPAGNPAVPGEYATAGQIANVPIAVKAAPATGFSLTFGNAQSDLVLNPAGTLAAGTVTLAANPSNNAKECIFSTQTITALTLNANTGQSINNAVTTLTGPGAVCYTYSLANTTWDRSR